MRATPLRTPLRELGEACGRSRASRDVEEARGGAACRLHLQQDERRQVVGMETVADLEAAASKADVGERLFCDPLSDPPREDSLIGPAKLSGPGHHAASVDEQGRAVAMGVFQCQCLARQFGGAVKRDGSGRGKILRDAGRADTCRQRLRGVDGEAWATVVVDLRERQRSQCRDRIDPARRQEHHSGLPVGRRLQQVDRADEIVLDQLP